MRSCRKKTGPGETNFVTIVISKVQIARIGSAAKQQAISIPRFQIGIPTERLPISFPTEGLLHKTCMRNQAARNSHIYYLFISVLAIILQRTDNREQRFNT